MTASGKEPGLAAAAAFVAAMASYDAATLFATVVCMRGGSSRSSFDLDAVLAASGLQPEIGSGVTRLETALDAFKRVFGLNLGYVDEPKDPALGLPALKIFERFVDLLDGELAPVASRDLIVPDAASNVWIAAIGAAIRAGHGGHLALRCDHAGPDDMHDFAGLVADGGTPVRIADEETVAATILRAELHAGDRTGLVVVPGQLLVKENDTIVDPDGYEWPAAKIDDLAPEGRLSRLRHALGAVRNLYLWRVPGAGILPDAIVGLLGGVVGPLRPDPAWSRFVVGAAAQGAGAAGVSAILGAVGDARRVDPVARMAEFVTRASGAAFDDGARFVARSFGARRATAEAAAPSPLPFDPRLVVADYDAVAFLDGAPRLRRLGCRILFTGPPGGGKSSLAAELSRRMAAGASGPGAKLRGETPVLAATAATLFVREYGGTERILAALFDRAATSGGVGGAAPILVDELDSFCGVRETGSSSGNNYLVRSLTNEWIRVLDANPEVPVLATCNDATAVDPAILRRFAFVVRVEADLTPDRERLAWSSILETEPPDGWSAVGASVSDIVLARARCVMMGTGDAAALATAIASVRAARIAPTARTSPRRRSVH